MKHKTLKIAIAGVIAFLIGFLSTIRSAPAQNRFDLKVRNDFFAGYAGDKDALARGMKACEAALAADPKNAEAMVWHGSGVMMEAQGLFASGDSGRAIPVWMRGLQEMQAAVDLAPDNVAVRIPRGAVLLTASHYIPDAGMSKPLIADGVSDYQRAYDLQKDYFATLGTHPRGELLMGLADGYSRLGDQEKAAAYFDEIIRTLPDSAYAKRANMWNTTKSLPLEQTTCVGCHVSKN
jgi:tetratricopeptide (TPR) repeat protein